MFTETLILIILLPLLALAGSTFLTWASSGLFRGRFDVLEDSTKPPFIVDTDYGTFRIDAQREELQIRNASAGSIVVPFGEMAGVRRYRGVDPPATAELEPPPRWTEFLTGYQNPRIVWDVLSLRLHTGKEIPFHIVGQREKQFLSVRDWTHLLDQAATDAHGTLIRLFEESGCPPFWAPMSSEGGDPQ